jgi:hypothetical protein
VSIQPIQLEPRHETGVVSGRENQRVAGVQGFGAVFCAGDDAGGFDPDDGVEAEGDVGGLDSLVEVFVRG